MSWYKRKLTKEAMAVKRDGLLGFGNVGWKDNLTEGVIKIAKEKVANRFSKISISDYDYLDPELFSDIEPEIKKIKRVDMDNKRSGEDIISEVETLIKDKYQFLTESFNDFTNKNMSPVVVLEDKEILHGLESLFISTILGVPVRTFVISIIK